jgi:L-threonylcarbamoyladenylate synthase
MLTGDTGTIGIRISPHPLARELIRTLGKPVTATSANLSGGTPAKTADEVLEMFQEKVDYILDGGATPAGLCSTVVGLEHGNLIILREGQLDASLQLAGIVGEARSKGE